MTTLGERSSNLVPLRGGPNENLVSSNSHCLCATQRGNIILNGFGGFQPPDLPGPGQTGRLGGEQSGHRHSGIYEEVISRGTLPNNGRQGLSRTTLKEKVRLLRLSLWKRGMVVVDGREEKN